MTYIYCTLGTRKSNDSVACVEKKWPKVVAKRKGNDSVACVEKKRPNVVVNVEFTLRQCKAAGLDQHPELSFESRGTVTVSGNCVLTCTRRDVYEHPTLGLVSQAKIVLDERGGYNAGCLSVFPALSRVASCLGLTGSRRLLFIF